MRRSDATSQANRMTPEKHVTQRTIETEIEHHLQQAFPFVAYNGGWEPDEDGMDYVGYSLRGVLI